jgi:hypothetical protein
MGKRDKKVSDSGEAARGPGSFPMNRRQFLIGALGASLLAAASVLGGPFSPRRIFLTDFAAAATASGLTSMYIVAHADDTLLFQSADFISDIQGGQTITSVYLTAGDDGMGESYWSLREEE